MPPNITYWIQYSPTEQEMGLLLFALRDLGPDGQALAERIQARSQVIVRDLPPRPTRDPNEVWEDLSYA